MQAALYGLSVSGVRMTWKTVLPNHVEHLAQELPDGRIKLACSPVKIHKRNLTDREPMIRCWSCQQRQGQEVSAK